MKETCYKLFSYWSIDSKAAQAFLNEMAARGWELDRVVLGLFARFRRTGRRDLSYFLDWTDLSEQEDPDYVRLCADAGWEKKARLGSAILYASRPGMRPVPIQTDPEIEYQRFRKKVIWILPAVLLTMLFCLVLPLLAFQEYSTGVLPSDLLLHSNLLVALLFSLPLMITGMALYVCHFAWRSWQLWQAHRNREAPPVPGKRACRLWGIFRGLCGLYLVGLLLCFFGDLILNDSLYTTAPSVILLGTIGCFQDLWRRHSKGKKWRLIEGPADILSLGMLVLLILFAIQHRSIFSAAPIIDMYSLICLVVLTVCWVRLPQEKRPSTWGKRFYSVLLLCLACCLLHGPVRQVFPGRIPPGPALPNASVLLESRNDTLFGSYAAWHEECPNGAIVNFYVKSWTTREQAELNLSLSAENAERVFGRQWIDMEGADGVYLFISDRFREDSPYFYYILRDKTLFRVSSPLRADMDREQLLSDILTWIEGVN